MKYGNPDALIAAAREAGHEPPAGAVGVYDVWPVSVPYREAWMHLHHGRVMDGASGLPQALPYAAVVLYAQTHGFADTIPDLDEFVELIYAQDAAFLAHATERAKART